MHSNLRQHGMGTSAGATLNEVAQRAEFYRIDANRRISASTRSELGQFLTPVQIAQFMASLFDDVPNSIRLLDPGAGTGSLTAAFVEEMIGRVTRGGHISVEAYEIDPLLTDYLKSTLEECRQSAGEAGIEFASNIKNKDFIEDGVESISSADDLFGARKKGFTHCIMNPPYKKISSQSQHRALMKKIGMETSNLYTAFLTVAIGLLESGGELVAIVPRSFCNGVYFKPFRQYFFKNMSLRHIHIFDSRNKAFKDDAVLQENIIFSAVKNGKQEQVTITASADSSFDGMTSREVPIDAIVKTGDPHQFIHIATTELDQSIVDRMMQLPSSLGDLGLDVATGPVVDFRLRHDISRDARKGLCPLIYPSHFEGSKITWPRPSGKKPNAIKESEKSSRWLMSNDWYVLTKRFSSKEERRRIVAAVYSPEVAPSDKVGFENHLNVFHAKKQGLEPPLARGLCGYLNSSLVDLYFRQFSGHTQVNAADLRILKYPSRDTLLALGERIGDSTLGQSELDDILDAVVAMPEEQNDAVSANRKIREALAILAALGLPRGQRNERSALTLLALLGVKSGDAWVDAGSPLMGITPIMEFCREHYGRTYAPNTRETFRRQTMHQFMDAGISVANPDQPDRPVNSPKWVYQIEPQALALIQSFGSAEWDAKLKSYLGGQKTLAERYAKEREMQMIPLVINEGKELLLTPGAHSQLIKAIIEDFGPRFAPGAEVLYVGDTGSKLGHFDESKFAELGLTFDSHGKFPDVVLYMADKKWLLLVESVTSHGPVDAKRHAELANLFKDYSAGLIFVTAFPDRATMGRYISEISWETEVWVAEAPSHLIHFDGERFLGPYQDR